MGNQGLVGDQGPVGPTGPQGLPGEGGVGFGEVYTRSIDTRKAGIPITNAIAVECDDNNDLGINCSCQANIVPVFSHFLFADDPDAPDSCVCQAAGSIPPEIWIAEILCIVR